MVAGNTLGHRILGRTVSGPNLEKDSADRRYGTVKPVQSCSVHTMEKNSRYSMELTGDYMYTTLPKYFRRHMVDLVEALAVLLRTHELR